MNITERLFELQDLEYKAFHSKLMPTINPDTIIGVRTPALRKLAKELKGNPEAAEFLQKLPHTYYEENNLHAFLIEQIKDYDTCIAALEVFLPYVDNWATCDMMCPKVLGKYLPELLVQIKLWVQSEHTYTIRFGMKLLMNFYMGDAFKPEYPGWVADVKSDEYYVKMMQAWYFATALALQYEETLPYLENQSLEVWTHNKAIRKAVESYRVSAEQKEYLRTLKIKGESVFH